MFSLEETDLQLGNDWRVAAVFLTLGVGLGAILNAGIFPEATMAIFDSLLFVALLAGAPTVVYAYLNTGLASCVLFVLIVTFGGYRYSIAQLRHDPVIDDVVYTYSPVETAFVIGVVFALFVGLGAYAGGARIRKFVHA